MLLLRRVLFTLLIIIWLISAGLNVSRPVFRLGDSDTESVDLPSLIIQNDTFHPRTYQTLADALHQASDQFNVDQVELVVTSDINNRQYRQLLFLARQWVYPKKLINNPMENDIQVDKMPILPDDCQIIQPEIALCPLSE